MDSEDRIPGLEVAVADDPRQPKRRVAVKGPGASTDTPAIFVVDPDPATGAMVNDLARGSNLRCESCCSGRQFLAAHEPSRPTCLVLEMRIPDMGGLQLQRRLAASGTPLPLVFVTSQIEISMAVEAMRGGAVHVLEKPARPLELWHAIEEAIRRDQSRCREHAKQRKLRERVAALTRKERQVVQLVAEGKSVKAMAAKLGLCVRAVELRRRSLMKKLGLHSPLELIRFSLLAVSREACPPLAVALSHDSPAAQCVQY